MKPPELAARSHGRTHGRDVATEALRNALAGEEITVSYLSHLAAGRWWCPERGVFPSSWHPFRLEVVVEQRLNILRILKVYITPPHQLTPKLPCAYLYVQHPTCTAVISFYLIYPYSLIQNLLVNLHLQTLSTSRRHVVSWSCVSSTLPWSLGKLLPQPLP